MNNTDIRNQLAALIEHEYDIADPFDEGYLPGGYALASVIMDAFDVSVKNRVS